MEEMKKVGLIVNPIAGMGGRVGLKGTDGKDILEKARSLGSTEEAPIKAVKALNKLVDLKDEIELLVAAGKMGEVEAMEAGLRYRIIDHPKEETGSSDTIRVAKKMLEEEVELLLFVGGDGTARDIFSAIETKIPCIGIPAGVKIHSPVYGNTPESGGHLAYEYLSGGHIPLTEEEVVDLDEEAFRNDEVRVQTYGFLKVPYNAQYLQNKKSPTPQSDEQAQESIALEVIDHMSEDVPYLIGSGTTPMYIMKELGLDYTILGVDIIKNRQLIAKDVNESDILEVLKQGPVKLVVTPMGGQGYLFGRGNQQLSANVLRQIDKNDIIVISTQSKLHSLGDRDLIIYTLDDEVDAALKGYYKVITGYGQLMVVKASTPE